jgi:thioredoxin 1
MATAKEQVDAELTRDQVKHFPGMVLLEFGAAWCGYCRSLAPHLAALLTQYPSIRHIKIEDGPGRPLGRSFGVKLWPTIVLLRDGKVRAQLVRPSSAELRTGLQQLAAGS